MCILQLCESNELYKSNPSWHQGLRSAYKKCNKKDDILFDKFPFDPMLREFFIDGVI